MGKRGIIVGENFLHGHPVTEKQLHLIKDRVIVDREDWKVVCEFFKSGSAVTWALEECVNSKHGVSAPESEQNAGTACEGPKAGTACEGPKAGTACEGPKAGTACEGPKNLVKPPLGIMPRKLWIEIRLKELSEAMYRYISVGSLIPEEWAQEYNQLLSELQK